MAYTVFDTETTGKPKKWNAPIDDTENYPRAIQLAYAMYRNDHTLIGKREKAMKEGVSLELALTEFEQCLKQSHTLIAHNIGFDYPVINCEFIREKMSCSLSKLKQICTLQSTIEFCALPNTSRYHSNFKYPKLIELHEIYLVKVLRAHMML